MIKLLHTDIETAPIIAYIWSLRDKYVPIERIVEPGYTMCWSAKWHHEDKIMFSSIHKDGMEKMLETMWELLEEADAVVHYNGEKFDIPTLNWEFVQHGWEPPSPYHQIDLYRVVKQRFKLPSYKLDYVSQALGLGAKVQHKGMDLWKECMAGNNKSWKEMEEYNRQDVALLPKLYNHLLPWIKRHPNHALYMDTDRPVCPNCGSLHVIKNGVETTLTMTYQRYKCMDCGLPIRDRTNNLDKEKKANILTASKL